MIQNQTSKRQIIAELPLMEEHYTIQGEGYNTGIACYFLRLGGCDVGCVWCDVKESWDANAHTIVKVDDMVKRVLDANAVNVVITGGEPLMYDLSYLTAQFQKAGINVFLETSGAYPVTGDWNWICVSPKKFKKPLDEVMILASELKVIVYNKSDFNWAEEQQKKVNAGCQLFLQPEFGEFDRVIPLIIDYVKQNPEWRISLQTHKILKIN